jgi:hypothetical protein
MMPRWRCPGSGLSLGVPAGRHDAQLVWALGSDRLVYAAGGSGLAISRDGGATFHDVFPWGAGAAGRANHVAVAASVPSAPAPPIVYVLGDGAMFVSFDGGTNWIADQGPIPPGAGGAVGTANSSAPSVLAVSPRSPFEVFLVVDVTVVNGVLQGVTLWRGHASSCRSRCSGMRLFPQINAPRAAAFLAAQNLTTLSCVNVAGAAIEGLGTTLSLNTGDNDGFYSMDGGACSACTKYRVRRRQHTGGSRATTRPG